MATRRPRAGLPIGLLVESSARHWRLQGWAVDCAASPACRLRRRTRVGRRLGRVVLQTGKLPVRHRDPYGLARISVGLVVLGTGCTVVAAPTQSADARVPPVNLWGVLLRSHVDDAGLVNYGALGEDARLHEHLKFLGNANPAGLANDKARLAFWINAYNALAIQGVLQTLPETQSEWPEYSVLDVKVPGVKQDGKAFFRGLRFAVGKRKYTLDEIEHEVLLQRSSWIAKDETFYRSVGVRTPDPRIHFALVCCAKGCPKLQREPYEASRVDSQLDDAIRRFARDHTRIRFDQDARVMHVSQLLDWYGKDLTDPRMSPYAGSVAKFLSRYVEDGGLMRSLAEDSWRTTYIEYDWKLNLQP